ncbi:U3 snoRNP protein [Ascodesmis nigricans]|uniref:U3 snoRNP protein n=1 Tax=Ascodesmis nigricans TaxID=341454 RepID=A0A4S2N7C0_9PEZI|nr:U3 snoRNP protein [Ascodesmis nigricans]
MAAEKARYFLEQSIPELRDYEKRGIFSSTEITSITRKRSDFEHRINAPGCHVADFTRYAQYEMNLEALYRKRVKRLGIKARLHYGSRRIFFVLDRATRKFPGDLGLWIQYIEFAKKEKAASVLAKVFASALKLHPTKPELWIYAAEHALVQNADVTEARSHMQRGLRFNKKSKELWVEYAKLEMVFVAKVFLRRQLLGIDKKPETQSMEDEGDDSIKLPSISAAELDPELAKKDQSYDLMALENVDSNPALNGALATAIFDQAMREVPNDVDFAMSFFNLFLQFGQLKCTPRLLEHVVKYMLEVAPTNPQALWQAVRLPIIHVEPLDPIYPGRFAMALQNMQEALRKVEKRNDLHDPFVSHFVGVLQAEENLDEALTKALSGSVVRHIKLAEREEGLSPSLKASRVEFKKWKEMRLQARISERREEQPRLSS